MEMLSQGLPGIGLVGVPTGLLVSGGLPCLVGKQGRFLRTPLPLLSYGAKSLLLRVGLRYAAAGCPAHFVSWHSFINSFLRLPHFGT